MRNMKKTKMMVKSQYDVFYCCTAIISYIIIMFSLINSASLMSDVDNLISRAYRFVVVGAN